MEIGTQDTVDMASQVTIQSPSTQETLNGASLGNGDNITAVLTKLRRKKSERILKQKLAKTVGGKDAEGNVASKPLNLE